MFLYCYGVQELGTEKLQMRKTQKELRKQHQQLTKDKSAKEKILSDLEARAHDVQVRRISFAFLACEKQISRTGNAASDLHTQRSNCRFRALCLPST